MQKLLYEEKLETGIDAIGHIAFCAEQPMLEVRPESYLTENVLSVGALKLVRNAP